MRATGKPQEYVFPPSWKLEPGKEYRTSGFIQEGGPLPNVTLIEYKPCNW